MKSIDKFVLVLVASLALLLAGCGGGSTSTPDPEPPAVDPAVAERAAINTAIMAARAAVPGVDNDSTDSEVSAAETAIANARKAIAEATNVPAEEKAANTATVETLAAQLTAAKTARMAAMDAADKAMAKAMAETGKLLRAALGPNATADTTALDNATAALSATGLLITATDGAGAIPDGTTPPAVTLEAGDSAGSLGGWMGMDYSHTDSGTKVKNEARVYTNKGPGKTVSLADAGVNVHTAATGGDDIKGYYTVDESADLAKIMSATFTHSGTQTHTYNSDNEVAFTTRGTFDGAPGEYRCTGTCSSTNDGKGSPSELTGVWHFKPDAGAMVHQPDAHYLYYGWWVSKDKDGKPTAASAFAGRFGTDPGNSTDSLDQAGDLTAIAGSASYSGNAAGKFAMSNPLDGTGNGGHFTADANLSATFGSGTTAGVTGTIDNFRLNDGSEDPGWSVSLARGAVATDGTITAPTADPTVWSINGNKAPASGTWSGTMYDEMPGDPPGGDGSNLPTTVTGTFYSEFSTVGRMVGAFGADKE